MDDFVPAKLTTIECLETKNAMCGKPSTSFLTTIKKNLKTHKLNIEHAVEIAQNRDLWKLERSRTSANKEL